MTKNRQSVVSGRQRGGAVVEFALVLSILIALLLGILELGRLLYMWNSLAEATRRGARTAAIVAVGNKTAVVNDMRIIVPSLGEGKVEVEYSGDGGTFDPAGCGSDPCHFVRVSIKDYKHRLIFIPGWQETDERGQLLSLPGLSFSSTLPVEALGAG